MLKIKCKDINEIIEGLQYNNHLVYQWFYGISGFLPFWHKD